MHRSTRAPLGLLLAVTLALSACGSGDSDDVTTGDAAGDSGSLGEFTDSKAELGALFDRLKGAGAVRIVQRQVGEGHEPGERDVFDVHFAPLTWRDRTYLDKLDHEAIRRGNDLFDISYHKINCPDVRYTGWFVYPDFSDVPADEQNLQLELAPGILPHVLYELQYAVFGGRTEEAGGYVLTGKVLPHDTGLGWGYEAPDPNAVDVEVPIRLRLDGTGLPVELTVDYAGSSEPSNSFTATFSYDDVEQVPTIRKPRVFDGTLDVADLCKNYE